MPSEEQMQRVREFLNELDREEGQPRENGALFWVPEVLWVSANSAYERVRRADRKGHPGCVHTPDAENAKTHVCMLHGHSKPRSKRYNLEVRGVRGGAERVTHFDVLHPFRIPNECFRTRGPSATPNREKPRLDRAELEALQRITVRVQQDIQRDMEKVQQIFRSHAAWSRAQLRDSWPDGRQADAPRDGTGGDA